MVAKTMNRACARRRCCPAGLKMEEGSDAMVEMLVTSGNDDVGLPSICLSALRNALLWPWPDSGSNSCLRRLFRSVLHMQPEYLREELLLAPVSSPHLRKFGAYHQLMTVMSMARPTLSLTDNRAHDSDLSILGQAGAATPQGDQACHHPTKAEMIRALTISMKKPHTRGTTMKARWAAPYCCVTAVMLAIAVAVDPSAIPPKPADMTTAS